MQTLTTKDSGSFAWFEELKVWVGNKVACSSDQADDIQHQLGEETVIVELSGSEQMRRRCRVLRLSSRNQGILYALPVKYAETFQHLDSETLPWTSYAGSIRKHKSRPTRNHG